MDILIGIYIFVLGAACGSFALVLADRMHAGKDWVKGRSVCDHCGHRLQPKDLVPLFSWLLQRGKCRYCKKKLSVYYPLVELGLASAFTASYFAFPYELESWGIVLFGVWIVGLVIMTALFVADLKWYLLPSKLVYPLIGLASVHWVVELFWIEQNKATAFLSLIGALAVGAGLFKALHALSAGRWIGDGDYRFGIAMGFFLGSPLTTWMSLFFASVLGLLFAGPILLKTKKKMKVRIPFGPFLILGLLISYLVGQQFLDWYKDAFLYL